MANGWTHKVLVIHLIFKIVYSQLHVIFGVRRFHVPCCADSTWLYVACRTIFRLSSFSDYSKFTLKHFVNLLKPTGHVMHQQFNIQQLYALPTQYLCVLYLSESKQRPVPLTA